MSVKNEIKLFEEKQVQRYWNAEKEKWYISVVDIITVLTESIDPNAYWRKLKQRLKEEGNETVTNCHGLKMLAQDGKMRVNDVECKRLNKTWLNYSGKIALRVLSAIEDIPGMNQRKLAELMGVTPQHISKIVKGQENLTLETIGKLSEALQIELIDFPKIKYS